MNIQDILEKKIGDRFSIYDHDWTVEFANAGRRAVIRPVIGGSSIEVETNIDKADEVHVTHALIRKKFTYKGGMEIESMVRALSIYLRKNAQMAASAVNQMVPRERAMIDTRGTYKHPEWAQFLREHRISMSADELEHLKYNQRGDGRWLWAVVNAAEGPQTISRLLWSSCEFREDFDGPQFAAEDHLCLGGNQYLVRINGD